MNTHTHIYIYMYTHIYIYMYTHTHIYIYSYIPKMYHLAKRIYRSFLPFLIHQSAYLPDSLAKQVLVTCGRTARNSQWGDLMLCLGDSACNLTRRGQKRMYYAQATVVSKFYKGSMLTAGEVGKATACKTYNNKRSCVATPQGTFGSQCHNRYNSNTKLYPSMKS